MDLRAGTATTHRAVPAHSHFHQRRQRLCQARGPRPATQVPGVASPGPSLRKPATPRRNLKWERCLFPGTICDQAKHPSRLSASPGAVAIRCLARPAPLAPGQPRCTHGCLVVWSLAFASVAKIYLPVWVPVLLALATWSIYIGDRLLDARRALRTGALHSLRERHFFHWRHRRLLCRPRGWRRSLPQASSSPACPSLHAAKLRARRRSARLFFRRPPAAPSFPALRRAAVQRVPGRRVVHRRLRAAHLSHGSSTRLPVVLPWIVPSFSSPRWPG